jgi:hypothetical protein
MFAAMVTTLARNVLCSGQISDRQRAAYYLLKK